jgi:hypothetical protein
MPLVELGELPVAVVDQPAQVILVMVAMVLGVAVLDCLAEMVDQA